MPCASFSHHFVSLSFLNHCCSVRLFFFISLLLAYIPLHAPEDASYYMHPPFESQSVLEKNPLKIDAPDPSFDLEKEPLVSMQIEKDLEHMPPLNEDLEELIEEKKGSTLSLEEAFPRVSSKDTAQGALEKQKEPVFLDSKGDVSDLKENLDPSSEDEGGNVQEEKSQETGPLTKPSQGEDAFLRAIFEQGKASHEDDSQKQQDLLESYLPQEQQLKFSEDLSLEVSEHLEESQPLLLEKESLQQLEKEQQKKSVLYPEKKQNPLPLFEKESEEKIKKMVSLERDSSLDISEDVSQSAPSLPLDNPHHQEHTNSTQVIESEFFLRQDKSFESIKEHISRQEEENKSPQKQVENTYRPFGVDRLPPHFYQIEEEFSKNFPKERKTSSKNDWVSWVERQQKSNDHHTLADLNEDVSQSMDGHLQDLNQDNREFEPKERGTVEFESLDTDPSFENLDQEDVEQEGVFSFEPPQERFFPISKLNLIYSRHYSGLPALEVLKEMRLILEKTEQGFTLPRNQGIQVEMSLKEIEQLPVVLRYSESAINYISRRIVEEINKQGIVGIYVSVDPKQIDPLGIDRRQEKDLSLNLFITASTVAYVQTITVGDEEDSMFQEEVDSDDHARIKKLSPVQMEVDSSKDVGNLLHKTLLENYIFFLNRHPKRRVDVRIRPEGADEASIHYLIREDRPWNFSYTTSNTSGDRWNNQFDLAHYQFTGSDDILKLSFSTNDFNHRISHTLSYDRPVLNSLTKRFEFHWNRSEFFSTTTGFSFTGDQRDVEGESFAVGGKFLDMIYQYKEFFLDAFLNATYRNIKVNNNIGLLYANNQFFFTELGLRCIRSKNTSNLFATFSVEKNLPSFVKHGREDLFKLGRGLFDSGWPDIHAVLWKWYFSFSFFIEPFVNFEAWKDVSQPDWSTMAHEILFTTSGQYTRNSRLIPQSKISIGGSYSVRGYPQDPETGDSGGYASLNYLFHLPRSWSPKPQKTPQEQSLKKKQAFKWRPSFPFDNPDWDLMIKVFMDFGRVINNGREETFPNEENFNMWGGGLGLELMIKGSLQFRMDWGNALLPYEKGDIGKGYQRLHFSFTSIF